jgi:hypothetical protein
MPTSTIRFKDPSLRKQIFRVARLNTITTVNTMADRMKARSIFMLTVLRASPAQQLIIKNLALASSRPGTKMLAMALSGFAYTSAANKTRYITAFKRRAAILDAAPRALKTPTVWYWGHTPPRFVP